MSEIIVIGVSKGYYHSSKYLSKVKPLRAKPVWFLYYRLDGMFKKKRISLLQVPLYRSQVRKLRTLVGDCCNREFKAYVKNEKENIDCPYCS